MTSVSQATQNKIDEVKKNIIKLLEMKDMKVLDKAHWLYETKMWNTTHDETCFMEMDGTPFEEADEEEIEELATCSGTSAGVLKEFLCGDMEWTAYTPSETAPLILHVTFMEGTQPTHELIIIQGKYVFQSCHEQHRIQKTDCEWSEISQAFGDASNLSELICPNGSGEGEVVVLSVPKF